jgi:hypothetical protein
MAPSRFSNLDTPRVQPIAPHVAPHHSQDGMEAQWTTLDDFTSFQAIYSRFCGVTKTTSDTG